MEPLFFKAENLTPNGKAYFTAIPGFNGAAFFQSGKSAGGCQIGSRFISELQWSRFFSKRKILSFLDLDSLLPAELQWSRFFSKRKMDWLASMDRQRISLQWSRFFSKRKMILACGQPEKTLWCFNGAAFFQSGK